MIVFSRFQSVHADASLTVLRLRTFDLSNIGQAHSACSEFTCGHVNQSQHRKSLSWLFCRDYITYVDLSALESQKCTASTSTSIDALCPLKGCKPRSKAWAGDKMPLIIIDMPTLR